MYPSFLTVHFLQRTDVKGGGFSGRWIRLANLIWARQIEAHKCRVHCQRILINLFIYISLINRLLIKHFIIYVKCDGERHVIAISSSLTSTKNETKFGGIAKFVSNKSHCNLFKNHA